MHIELLTAQAVQPNTGLAATALAGQSLIVKNSKSRAEILAMWQRNQVAGTGQIVTPSGHDTTRGYRFNVPLGEIVNRIPHGLALPVEPQETISYTISGSNVAGDVETACMLILYPDLPGTSSRLATWETVNRTAQKLTTISATLTGAATGRTGAEAITSESDLLLANRDYAVLGMTSSLDCAAVQIEGPDTGNVPIGCPGDAANQHDCAGWFARLSREQGRACIPVINSGNRASTVLSFVQDENNISPLVTLFLALLPR